jgi:replication factor A1
LNTIRGDFSLTSNEIELAPHIEDIKRALGESVSIEKIKEELEKYFEYGVGVIEAKKAIVKKLGGNLNVLFKGVDRSLADVLPTDNNIDLKVKIISINDKTVTVSGSEKVIFYGLIADQTMVRPFTAWNDFKLAKNNVVHIHSAYAKDWRGEPQINLGNNTSVEPLEDTDLEQLEPSSVPSILPGSEYEIGSLREGLSNITVTGRILSVEPRTVTAMGEEKEIYTGILADQTGKIAFTAWSNFNLEKNEVIKVDGAYIRSWRGVPKLNFDDRMELERLADDKLPNIEELSSEQLVPIDHLLEIGGGMDVTVEGIIIDIKEGSGLIIRCPECKRVLRNGECMVHGAQDGKPDLRVKAVLDDGAGSIITVLNAELTSKLLGKSVSEVESETKEKGPENLESIFQELNDILLLQPLRAKGTVTTDDYGAMMICTDMDLLMAGEEVPAKAKELLDKINMTDWTSGVE